MPIVPDEARTFGMESLFRAVGIYSHVGQKYEPVDMDTLLYYKEAQDGQILEEGHHRGGLDVIVHRRRQRLRVARRQHDPVLHLLLDVRIPARRRPDLGGRRHRAPAASCSAAPPAARRWQARGCSTRTATRHVISSSVPNCVSYDPAFAYELAVIIEDGIRRMYREQESVFYYLTVMNEQYAMPAMPEGARDGILKGLYRFKPAENAEARSSRRSCSAAARS